MKYIIIIILALFSGWMISDMFRDDSSISQAERDQLKRQKENYIRGAQKLNLERFYLYQKLDSLENIPREIEKQVIYLQAGVDSIIAKDSLNSIREYRSGLKLLGIRPESTPTPTLREIGLGAHIFRETWGFRLNVPVLKETIFELKNLDIKNNEIIATKDSVISTDNQIIEAQDLRIDELDSFWRNRFVWTIGVYYIYVPTTQETRLGFGTGIGIRLWGNGD